MIIVFINVQVEGRVAVYIVWSETRTKSLLYHFISQPLIQFRRSTHIVDDALLDITNT